MSRPQFVEQETQDFTSKIRKIVDRVSCKKHDARIGQPCWWINSDVLYLNAAVCGHRIRKVYVGNTTNAHSRRLAQKGRS